MKQALAAVMMIGALTAQTAHASDKKVLLPISAALETAAAKEKLDPSIKLFFGKQATPKVLKKLGTDTTSQKTNAFGKSDDKACNWVFLSDMLSLQKRARELGANAVINITSNYKNVPMESDTEFECHVGAIMAGAAFKAEFVKIAE